MYTVGKTYLVWALSFIIPGLHRLYLGKTGTGVLFLCTFGFGHIGTILDAFNIPRLVEDANMREHYRQSLYAGNQAALEQNAAAQKKPKTVPDSIEKVILKVARKNKGQVTPGEVAIESDLSIDQAKEALDKIASKGYAEMRVKGTGVIVYCFPEFMEETAQSGFEV